MDTLFFAQKLYPELKRFRLNAVCKHLGVSLKNAQRAVHDDHAAAGHVPKLEVAAPGKLSAEDYDRSVRDITAFLKYVAEPAALQREATGLWVILFLVGFTLLAWMLKKEYWKDVH